MDDVHAKILSRLCVKDLLRYKCVSTNWRQLISSPYFIKMHMRHSLEKPIFMVCFDEHAPPSLHAIRGPSDIDEYHLPTIEELPISDFEENPDVFTVASFNGLLCCLNYPWEDDIVDFNRVEITICNPLTKKVCILPKGSPCSSYLQIGVGYEPGLAGYRIYRFFGVQFGENLHVACEVYSSSSANWRVLGFAAQYPMRYVFAYPATYQHICIRGKVYWFVDSGNVGGSPGSILYVDNEDNFYTLNLPQEAGTHTFMLNFDGILALVMEYDDEDADGIPMNVWIHWDNGTRWYWICNITVPVTPEDLILSVTSRHEELFFITRDHCGVYNLCQRTWTDYGLYNDIVPPSYQSVAFLFSESLLPCNGQLDEEA